MSQNYFVLKIHDVPVDQLDILTGELFEHGSTGVQEDLPFKQEGEFYDVTELERTHSLVVSYFSEAPSADLMSWITAKLPGSKTTLTEEAPKDWLAEWKKGYASFELVSGIYVVPSWLPIPDAAKAALKIDPGMAFGTGTHETTQLASGLIADIPNFKGKTVLDVGTGTGILALLSEKLGASRSVGTEIDPEARRTARENIELNTSQVEILEYQIEEVGDDFDLVIANIIDGVLVALQADLKRCVKPNGYLLLTGILDERELNFRERFDFSGFEVIRRAQKNEWVGFLAKRV